MKNSLFILLICISFIFIIGCTKEQHPQNSISTQPYQEMQQENELQQQKQREKFNEDCQTYLHFGPFYECTSKALINSMGDVAIIRFTCNKLHGPRAYNLPDDPFCEFRGLLPQEISQDFASTNLNNTYVRQELIKLILHYYNQGYHGPNSTLPTTLLTVSTTI